MTLTRYVFKKTLIFGLILNVLALGIFGMIEPQITTAIEDQIVITQTVTAELTITSPADITMSPSIPGLTGGSATGTATWIVVTNNNTGFNVTHVASSVAMVGDSQGEQFDEYTQASGSSTPDLNFSIAATAKEFAWSVHSTTSPGDITLRFRDNGTNCNAGTVSHIGLCWKSASTTAETFYNRTTETNAAGQAFTIDYQAELGTSATLTEDTYTATTTVTAVTN